MNHSISQKIAELLNVAAMTVPFAYAWYKFYRLQLFVPFYRRGNWVVIGLFVLIYILLVSLYDAFRIMTSRISELIYSQCLGLLVSDVVMYIVMSLLAFRFVRPFAILQCFVLQVVIAVIWAMLAHKWFFYHYPAVKTFIIFGDHADISDNFEKYGLTGRFDVVGSIGIDEYLRGDVLIPEDIKAMFICGVKSHDRNKILKYCYDHDIEVYVIPSVGDILMSSSVRMHLFHMPIMLINNRSTTSDYLFFKRVFDVILSLLALIITSPILLITMIAIKLDSSGPAFFRQSRLTEGGRTFEVLKFRSMIPDAEADGVARLSSGNADSRVTKVGRIIRRYRIDELPQFINILKGDMSLVGPRPERPEIAAQYAEEFPEFSMRLHAKAGLTGYAQIYGQYNTTPYDKLKMDLMYISNISLITDFRILLSTVKVLFMKESTEGVAETQITAGEKK